MSPLILVGRFRGSMSSPAAEGGRHPHESAAEEQHRAWFGDERGGGVVGVEAEVILATRGERVREAAIPERQQDAGEDVADRRVAADANRAAVEGSDRAAEGGEAGKVAPGGRVRRADAVA